MDAEETTIPADTFEARLMLARLHAGRMSIREAAQLCGFTNESWSNWERGKMPRDKLGVAEVVSERLRVDFDWLLRGGALAPDPRRRPGRVLHRAVAQPETERSSYSASPPERTAHIPQQRHTSTGHPMSVAAGATHDRPPGRPDAATGPRQHRTQRVDRPAT
jgi:transcriptional regulator with XRE-family HTH domain